MAKNCINDSFPLRLRVCVNQKIYFYSEHTLDIIDGLLGLGTSKIQKDNVKQSTKYNPTGCHDIKLFLNIKHNVRTIIFI